jgi:hypothetical protein
MRIARLDALLARKAMRNLWRHGASIVSIIWKRKA